MRNTLPLLLQCTGKLHPSRVCGTSKALPEEAVICLNCLLSLGGVLTLHLLLLPSQRLGTVSRSVNLVQKYCDRRDAYLNSGQRSCRDAGLQASNTHPANSDPLSTTITLGIPRVSARRSFPISFVGELISYSSLSSYCEYRRASG